MDERLQKDLSTLEGLIGIQRDCVIEGSLGVDYMHGMLNGLICAHATFADCSPKYLSRPYKYRHGKKIRHKSMKVKGRR